jgi:hypothetical protein
MRQYLCCGRAGTGVFGRTSGASSLDRVATLRSDSMLMLKTTACKRVPLAREANKVCEAVQQVATDEVPVVLAVVQKKFLAGLPTDVSTSIRKD